MELVLDFLNDFISGFTIETVLIILVIVLIVFLLLREVYTWYWKINKLIRLQKEQNHLLEDILVQLKNNK
ncbi:MAG: hypothetical protein PHP65_01450 [Bacilli bacterium]|nr:hypothetical protein [Bacilli bacterium]